MLSNVKSENVWFVEHETDMLTLAITIVYQTHLSLLNTIADFDHDCFLAIIKKSLW